jgi:hypothetical protein
MRIKTMSTVKSAKGELVNFDLLRIKQQIASAPQTTTVAARQNFIDNKLKRRIKKQARDAAEVQVDESATMPEGPISAGADDEITSNEPKLVVKKEKK